MKEIAFRADGNSSIGLGHMMRMSTLMQILQPHFKTAFYTRNTDLFPVSDFEQSPEVHEVSDLPLNAEAEELSSRLKNNTMVVLDGYQFTTSYQQILKQSGLKMICIDDIMSSHFIADAVINHAGGLKVQHYSCEPYTKLFLGPQYALVNPLFYQLKNIEAYLRNHKLLIALGGADPGNDTEKVLNNISLMDFDEVHVLLGGANKNAAQLKEKYKANVTVYFHQNLCASGVCQLMLTCSEAVLSPSTICYEYMCVGGTVYLYQIADNQENIKKYFLEEQLAFSFDKIGYVSQEQMNKNIGKQRQVFDGKSPQRLLQVFYELAA